MNVLIYFPRIIEGSNITESALADTAWQARRQTLNTNINHKSP